MNKNISKTNIFTEENAKRMIRVMFFIILLILVKSLFFTQYGRDFIQEKISDMRYHYAETKASQYYYAAEKAYREGNKYLAIENFEQSQSFIPDYRDTNDQIEMIQIEKRLDEIGENFLDESYLFNRFYFTYIGEDTDVAVELYNELLNLQANPNCYKQWYVDDCIAGLNKHFEYKYEYYKIAEAQLGKDNRVTKYLRKMIPDTLFEIYEAGKIYVYIHND